MTKQETFDIVARHLLTQKVRSERIEGDVLCMYRAENGLKCAIGALIPDEIYKPEMEGLGSDMGIVAETLFKLGHDAKLCINLQRIHDCERPSYWREMLACMASIFGLSAAVLDEFPEVSP